MTIKQNCIIQTFAYIKRDDISEDVETRFDNSTYELDRPLPNGKDKKAIGLKKDDFGEHTMTKFVGLTAKVDSYLTDDGSGDKTVKDKH